MDTSFSSYFTSMLGKGLAIIIIMLLLVASVAITAYVLKPNIYSSADTTLHKDIASAPEYKSGGTLSTAKIEELKINNEKLESFITNINSICSQYNSK